MWSYFRDGRFLGDIRFYLAIFIIFLIIVIWKNKKTDSLPDLKYKIPEKTYVDEKGVVHNQQTTESVTTNVLDRLVDSLISENRNLRNSISLLQVTVKTDTIFRERIKWLDTTSGEFEIAKRDEWVDITAKGNIKTGEGTISLKTQDTISVVTRRKNNLFKADETIIDFSTASPYNKTQYMRSFSLKERKSIITIGPSVSYIYTGKEWKPGVGVSMVYNLFSIKTRK